MIDIAGAIPPQQPWKPPEQVDTKGEKSNSDCQLDPMHSGDYNDLCNQSRGSCGTKNHPSKISQVTQSVLGIPLLCTWFSGMLEKMETKGYLFS